MALLKFHFLAFLLSGGNAFSFSLNLGCTLDLNKIESKNIPVFFNTSNLELPNQFSLPKSEEVNIACVGPRNYLQQSHSVVTTATCIEGSYLRISGKVVDYKNLSCSKPVEATVKILQSYKYECWPSTLLSIGYQIDHNFLEKIQLCYNNESKSTVYTRHNIYRKDLQNKAHVRYGSNFKANEVGLQRQKLDSAYRNARDINRGHLAPQADFSTANSQKLTYFYVNVFPQWVYINNGNWKNLEESIRRHPYNDLTVITGTYGLRPDHKHLLPPYQLPVPQYAWKAVYDRSLSKGIVFLSLNNPIGENILIGRPPCDHCSVYKWGNENWSSGGKGYIFCCRINQQLPPNILRVLPNRRCGVLKGR